MTTHTNEDINISQVAFQVDGLRCEGCRSALEICIKRRDGVLDAAVDLDKKQVHVWYDPSLTTWRMLKSRIWWCGYDKVTKAR